MFLMLNDIKRYINQLTSDAVTATNNSGNNSNGNSNNSSNANNTGNNNAGNSTSGIEMPETRIIRGFEEAVNQWLANPDFPKRMHDPLHNILKTVKEIEFEAITMPEQILIHKIMDTEIPEMVRLYLSLPKGHAVSFILENGKTSKDTMIEKGHSYHKKISDIWQHAVEEKTRQLVKQQKKEITITAQKKDFFDL